MCFGQTSLSRSLSNNTLLSTALATIQQLLPQSLESDYERNHKNGPDAAVTQADHECTFTEDGVMRLRSMGNSRRSLGQQFDDRLSEMEDMSLEKLPELPSSKKVFANVSLGVRALLGVQSVVLATWFLLSNTQHQQLSYTDLFFS